MMTENRSGTTRLGKTMMYDENCFERWSADVGLDYLSLEKEDSEKRKCSGYDCENEAVIEIDKDWYCAECALLLEEK